VTVESSDSENEIVSWYSATDSISQHADDSVDNSATPLSDTVDNRATPQSDSVPATDALQALDNQASVSTRLILQVGPKNQTYLSTDNFAIVSGRKACDRSKVSECCRVTEQNLHSGAFKHFFCLICINVYHR